MRALAGAVALAVTSGGMGLSAAPAAVAGKVAVSAADGLLAADRAFATQAAGRKMPDALAAMLADEVVMPLPGGTFARDRAAALAAISANADNVTSTVNWAPIRAVLSADGRDGFTLGYMTVTRANGTTVIAKYLSYWIRGADGWRVFAYRRGFGPDMAPAHAMLPAVAPARSATARNAAEAASDRASLIAAEQAFSDRAQNIGIGPAFAQTGRPEAINMGGPGPFIVGPEAIGAGNGSGTTSPVNWRADDAHVARSGDLGVTWGTIRSNTDKARPPSAFFTIWRRDGRGDDWRYIAE